MIVKEQTNLNALLNRACEQLHLLPTFDQKKALLEFLMQLLKWNKTYNLTAIRDPEIALIHHVFDSLAVVNPILHYFSGRQQNQFSILDVGSGAGLPAIVLAIMIPSARITCIDPVEKKMTFVRQAISVLGQTNVEAIHNRVERLMTDPYDLVISRAFASLEDFANLAGSKVKLDGALLAMKGKYPHVEIEQLERKTGWFVDRFETLVVPQLEAQRCLIWMKSKKT